HLDTPSFPTRRSSDLSLLKPCVFIQHLIAMNEHIQSVHCGYGFFQASRKVCFISQFAWKQMKTLPLIVRTSRNEWLRKLLIAERSEEHTSELQSREKL